MLLFKFCILIVVLVESEGVGESICECSEDVYVLNCGNVEGRTDIITIQGCHQAKTIYARGTVIGIKDRRGIRLNKVTLYHTTMTCEQVYQAVPTLKATLNGDDCPDAPVFFKTSGPRPPVIPVGNDDNDDGNDDNDDGNDNDDDGNDDDDDGNGDDDDGNGDDDDNGNGSDDDGNDDDDNGNDDNDGNDDEDDDNGNDDNNNTTQITTNVTMSSRRTVTPRIIVLEGNVTLYSWLVGISFAVLFIGGGWLAIIRIRARCTVSRERRVQVPEVSSTSSEDCTTYVLREAPKSPRRRGCSMEPVQLYAVDEF